MTKASEEYEKFVQSVLSSMVGVDVHHQKTYTGRASHRDIKVDVSFNFEIAGANLLFLIECKYYSHNVPVDDVEEFHSKIDDVGAHKGILVTTKGFQEGAVKTARGRGIALALLTKERQMGEMMYVVNSQHPLLERGINHNFWQGNVKGPFDNFNRGIRFESFGQFLGILAVDAMDVLRQKQD